MNALPPGPDIDTGELLGIFFTNPFPFLQKCLTDYGNIFTLTLGDFGVSGYGASGKWVFLTHADDLKTLYKAKSNTVLAGKANYIQFARLLPIDGSVMLDGKEHTDRRQILSKLIQGNNNIREFADDIVSVTNKEIDSFAADQPFELAASFQRITSEVMRHLNFGSEDNPGAIQISEKLSKFGEIGLSMEGKHQIISDCTAIVGDIMRDFKSKCPHAGSETPVLAEEGRPKDAKSGSMLSTLVEAQSGDKGLSDKQLQAELVVLLVAGTDTTATALTWVMAQLLSDPAIYARASDEVKQILDGKPEIRAEDFDGMPYLEAVILEACRVSPQLFTTSVRLLTEPLEVGGYLLPAGTIVANTPYLVHTRPDHYTTPLKFDPERFLKPDLDNPGQFLASAPDPFKHVFFGGGNRRCIGMAFALYEMKVILALFLSRTRLEPVNLSLEPEMQGGFFGPRGGVLAINR